MPARGACTALGTPVEPDVNITYAGAGAGEDQRSAPRVRGCARVTSTAVQPSSSSPAGPSTSATWRAGSTSSMARRRAGGLAWSMGA
jgi:hypothetical protein